MLLTLLTLLACSGLKPSAIPAEDVVGIAAKPAARVTREVVKGFEPPADPVKTEAADPLVASMASKPLIMTRHGSCRMACRHIDQAEVDHLLQTGTVDPSRTRQDGDCPTHAVEGETPDGTDVRLVFAACDDVTKLVTAIDLDRDWDCDCD